MKEITLQFETRDGAYRQIVIPIRMLATDGEKVIRRLEAEGVEIAPDCEQLVLRYIIDMSARLTPESG